MVRGGALHSRPPGRLPKRPRPQVHEKGLVPRRKGVCIQALCDVNVSYGYDDPAECNAPPAADKVCSGLQAMKLVHYPEYGRSQWECLAK